MKKISFLRRIIRAINPWRPHWGMMTAWDEHHGYFRVSYSQYGEDLALHALLAEGKNEIPWFGFYVDVGAYDPERYSNTFLFYRQGWQGINIEANPEVFSALQKHRPRDLNLHIGIKNQEGESRLYMFQQPACNTFSEEVARSYAEKGIKLLKTERVKTTCLATVLDKNLPFGQSIDFLSVDVEGLDLEVLESNNWQKYRPKFVVVESHLLDFEKIMESPIYCFMKEKGYRLVTAIYITLIFKRDK